MRSRVWTVVCVVLIALVAATGLAQEYPSRSVTLIVPTAPGGSASISGQILAEALKRELGQPVVISYKPGAAQALGTEQVLKAPPDGYTLGYTFEPDLASKIVKDGKSLSFGKDDFTHIGATAFAPYLLWVKSDAPWKTLDELLAYGRQKEISYSSNGVATMNHVYVEAIARKTGIKTNHVPYQGGGPATTALLGGHVDMTLGSFGRMKQYLDSGLVRALVVLSAERFPDAKEVPTLKEKGFDVEGHIYHHLFGPKGLPPAVVARLAGAFEKALANPETKAALVKAGFEPRVVGPEATKAMWEADFKVVEEILAAIR